MPKIATLTVNPALDVAFEIERMLPENKLRGTRPVIHPGGGGLNVARVTRRLDAEVEALWVGGGADAIHLGTLLDEEGVPHACISSRDEVRRNLHVEERATGHMFRLVLPGAHLHEDEHAAILDRVRTLDNVAYLVLSGSLPPGVPPDFYARLAACGAGGARVVLDTSGDALAQGLAGRVYLAKPNRNELGRLLGRTLADLEDVARAAAELISSGRVEVLAVSLAEEGLLLVSAAETVHLEPPKVEMLSAVGAGDSTVAGIVVGLARGLSLVDATRLGVAAGTAAVLTEATELCRPEDVERIYPQIRSTHR